jgi:ribose transport system substrate-binding protein
MRITYYVPDLENPFWRQVISGTNQAAKAHGAIIEAVGSAHDEKRFTEQLEAYALKKPDAVMVSPIKTKTITSVCRAICQSGVPVVAVDQNMTTYVTASIISGNLRGGAMAAMYLAERLATGKCVVHIQAEEGLENVVLRRNSFTNEINRRGLRVVKQLKADSSRLKAREQMKVFLSEGTGFDAVFAENDAMALGVTEALKESHFTPWPLIVGYDGIMEALEAIRDGRMEATVAQNPEALGEKAVELVSQIIRRQPFEELATVLPKMVTKDDLK